MKENDHSYVLGLTANYVLIAAACLTAAVASGEEGALSSVERAELPIYRVGDSWLFGKDGKPYSMPQSVIEVTSHLTRITIPSAHDVTHEIDIDATGNETSDGYDEYRPSHDQLRFPLTVGASWGADYIMIPTGRDSQWITHHASVEAAEIVHVPAGDFFAFRIVNTGTANTIQAGRYAGSNRFSQEYWYAPSAKRIVKMDATVFLGGNTGRKMQWELFRYSPANATGAAVAPASSQ